MDEILPFSLWRENSIFDIAAGPKSNIHNRSSGTCRDQTLHEYSCSMIGLGILHFLKGTILALENIV
jgi:hypothetical protein